MRRTPCSSCSSTPRTRRSHPRQRTELAIPAALDELLLACLAKRPDDRPQNATDLGRRLAAAVNGDGWTQERAQRWWERHHPEKAGPTPTQCGGMTLTKMMGTDSEAEEGA